MEQIKQEEFEAKVLKNSKPVLVDFFATWCGPCRMLTPILEQVSAENNGAFDIVKIDVDEAEDLSREFGIMSIPTLMVFKDGKLVKRESLRETFAFQVSALASLQFGKRGIDHIHEIVTATVSVYDTEGVHVRILAKVFQLGLLVVGVHGYRHGTNLGTGIEEGEPVGHVSCPDSHVRTSFHTDGEQAFRHVVHPFIELTPCEAQVAVGVDDVFFVGSGLSPMLEPVAEGSIG